jgi:glycine/D-amino acid oxidase-like deaminating enzyme
VTWNLYSGLLLAFSRCRIDRGRIIIQFVTMASADKSYLIIGAGVFGVSTAYYLIKKYPTASVTIVDRDAYDASSRVAASWDWNKVVRADYDDLVYCRMGLESQDIFLADPLWKPYFHQTGIYWLCRDEYADKVVENYRKLGRKADLRAVPVEEARKLYGGIFSDADFDGVKAVLVNKTSGWGAAGDCLRAVTKEAIRLGVKYEVAEVASLLFDSQGRCTGVKTDKGKDITASQTILSTGAYTPKLLEQAAMASRNFSLRAGDRIVAAGITTGMVTLPSSERSKYASMPVGVQGYTASTGPFIGSLPPTPDGELKWWGQTIFRNTQEIYPGRHVSIPPEKSDYAQWDIPEGGRLRRDIEHARDVFYGAKSKNWKMEKHRVCW